MQGRHEPLTPEIGEVTLPRVLGVGSATAVVMGIMIGSGIFMAPPIVAAELPTRTEGMLCWVIGGLLTICGALSVAELAAALPRSGGPFAYLLEAYGPLPAFLFGWTALTVTIGAGIGATAMVFSDYLAVFVPLTSAEVHEAALSLIVVVGGINYLGVRRAAAVMNVATATKLIAILALGVLALAAVHTRTAIFSERPVPDVPVPLFAMALIPIMWAYGGWQELTFLGGELRQPQRTFPLTLILGTGGVIGVYLLLNLGIYSLLPRAMIAHSSSLAADVATQIPVLREGGAAVGAGIVLLATFSSLNGTIMAGPRLLYSMSNRGLLFAPVGRVSPWFKTPSVAIWLSTFLGCAYALVNRFAQLADLFFVGAWPFYMLTVAAVFVLRRTRPDLPRPYRTWGYPFVPAAFLLASLGIIGSVLAMRPWDAAFNFIIIASGVPAYFFWRGLAGRVPHPRRATARNQPS
jgi:APA family basic amino acid/polyamine antiporter